MSNPEEKNENNVVDVNANAENKTAETQERNPFDSEDTLDIETNQEEKSEDTATDGKPGFSMKTVLIVAFLLIPVIYIVYKTMGNSKQEQAVAQAPKVDIAAFENATRANPTYSNLLNLSNVYINNGMAGKSIAPLEQALALEPNSAAVYNNLGFAYTIMQQYKKGIEYCSKAVALDTTFLLAKNNLNWAKTEQQKLIDAITELEKTPEDKRTNDYYMLLGLSYLKLQEYEKSIVAWTKILATDPKSIGALNNIGVSYMSMQEIDKAIDVFKKATEYNTNDQLSKNNLGWAMDEKKKAEEAKAEAKAQGKVEGKVESKTSGKTEKPADKKSGKK
jgi:tetratricopeptide (TPR) repeat protein